MKEVVSMQNYYLKVNDRELRSRAGIVKNFFFETQEVVANYKENIKLICDTAIMSGELHDALECYLEYIQMLDDMLAEMGEKYVYLNESFIEKIDNIDDYLYEMTISEKTRDFSNGQYEMLLQCLDDPWCEITDNIGDLIYSAQSKLADFFDWDSQKKKLNDSHKILLDYNDECAGGLKNKFDLVHDVDGLYGSNDDANYFGYFGVLMDRISKFILLMKGIMENSKMPLTIDYINETLSGPYKEMRNIFDTNIAICKSEKDISISEIASFADWIYAESVFNDFIASANAYVSEVGTIDALGMVVFNSFGIVDDVVVQKISSGACRSYQDYIVKKQLFEAIEDMSSEYVYSGSEEEKLVDDCKTFIEYVQKYGDKWYDKLNTMRYGEENKLVLDGRTKEAKAFKSFLEGLGGAEKILSYGSDTIEYIARLFVSYKEGLDIIDALERNFNNDATMQTAINDIRQLFNKEFFSWTLEALEGITKILYEGAKSELKKLKIPVLTVVSSIEKGIDIVGETTGIGTKMAAQYEALQLYNLQNSSWVAYRNAVQKLKDANPEDGDYEQLANDVKHCFQLHKKNMEKMFAKMAESESGEKKAYYKYCKQQVESLSMLTLEEPNIMSFEEFQALT